VSPRLFGVFGKVAGGRGPTHDRPPATLPKRDYLLTIDIFRDLPPEVFDMIDRQVTTVTFAKGRHLYSQEDRGEALFLLKKGRIQLYRLTPGGKRLDLETIEPGTFFGEMPLLGESLHNASAVATEDSLLCVMSAADVERLIREQPRVALRMIEALGRRLTLAEARLEELAYRSVPARIAAVLLRLSQGRNTDEVRVTHQELGDMIGALRETVTKILDEFQAEGLVELGRGRIALRDVDALRERLEE
jgi:CRP/FNR family transcriptional regulator, cyclic AMP receptor protein